MNILLKAYSARSMDVDWDNRGRFVMNMRLEEGPTVYVFNYQNTRSWMGVRLADIHLSQTLRKAGALCTGYDLMDKVNKIARETESCLEFPTLILSLEELALEGFACCQKPNDGCIYSKNVLILRWLCSLIEGYWEALKTRPRSW